MKPNNRNALALALLTMSVVATAPAMAGCDLTDGGFLAQAIEMRCAILCANHGFAGSLERSMGSSN